MLIKSTKIQHDLYKAECDSVKRTSIENPYEFYVMFENHSFLFFFSEAFFTGSLEEWSCFIKWNCFLLSHGEKYCNFSELKSFQMKV